MSKQTQSWTCGLCHIITFGEWDAEIKPKDDPNGEWTPCCKLCNLDIREDFQESDEKYEEST